MRRWWQHAFAVEPEEPALSTDADRAQVQRVCDELARRKLTLPALMLLESFRPLAGLAPHAAWFFSPFVAPFTRTSPLERLASWLQQPQHVEALSQALQTTVDCNPTRLSGQPRREEGADGT